MMILTSDIQLHLRLVRIKIYAPPPANGRGTFRTKTREPLPGMLSSTYNKCVSAIELDQGSIVLLVCNVWVFFCSAVSGSVPYHNIVGRRVQVGRVNLTHTLSIPV